jgi:hypothetical protein
MFMAFLAPANHKPFLIAAAISLLLVGLGLAVALS